MYILDTNVISELRKLRQGLAHPNVMTWAGSRDALQLYISAVTVEELEIGVLRMERRDPVQGLIMRAWLNGQVKGAFSDRILPVDLTVVERSARLHVPNSSPIRDAFIAATALEHSMTLVTRNVQDFRSTGVELSNPWQP